MAQNRQAKKVTVAINGYKNPNLLRQCLRSVQKNLHQVPFEYEIIVCDSATEDDTHLLMTQEFPEVVFFPFQENVVTF